MKLRQPITLALLAVLSVFAVQAQTLPEPLQQAVRKAVQTNPEVQARWHGLRAALNEQDAMRGAWLPQIDYAGSVGRERRKAPEGDRGEYSVQAHELTLTQLLFDGMLTSSEVKRLGYVKLSKYYELQQAAEATALATVQAYTDVVRYRELVEVGRDNYSEHKQSVLQLEESAKAGVRRGADVEQANGRLALAEANLVVDLTHLHNASVRYQNLVGDLPPARLPAIADDFRFSGLPGNSQVLLSEGLAGNPALNAALESVRATRQAVTSRDAAMMPRVDLTVAASREKNTQGVLGDTRVHGLALDAQANLFRGGADSARQRQALAVNQQAREQQENACRDARQTLTVAFNDMRSMAEQRRYKDVQRLATEKSREAYRQQFNIGQRTLLDLLDSQSEFFEATRAYIEAHFNQVAAQARTLAGMGQLVATMGATRTNEPTPEQLELDRKGMDAADLCAPELTEVDTVEAIKARFAVKPPQTPGSYLMLIPSPDGTVGRVMVQGKQGEQVLTKGGEIALLDGSPLPVGVAVDKPQLERDFSAAIAARPPIPEQFVLYFKRGGTQLTTESKAMLPKLFERVRARQNLDIWLIGHTDTVGTPKRNDALGLQRAKTIAKLLRQKGLKSQSMTLESYGERSPQLATPDETDEPRNRRGEVTLR